MIRSRAVKRSEIARRAGYSRQHLVRMREGHRTSPRSEDAVAAAVRAITHEDVPRDAVFEERQPSLHDILGTATSRRRKGSREAAKHASLADQFSQLSEDGVEPSIARLRTSAASEAATRELLDAGEVLLDRNPGRADALYDLAVRVTTRLGTTPAPLAHSLRGLAEKGRANALRMTGRYQEALSALARSEREFEAAQYCSRELGYARYCRGTVLFKMERWADAERAVGAGRALLETEHDRAGVVNCDILLGCILLERGELDHAREIFLAQRKIVEARRDYRRLADLWMNLVVCDLRRRDMFSAGHWLGRAVRKFRELGLTSEITRGRWCGASLALAQGQRDRALREFRAAATEFERLGMPADAGFVKLDLLAELVADKKWREAEPLAHSLADLFLKAGIAPSAATALDYLRQTVKARSADREIVKRVERHLHRSEVFPDEPFTVGLAEEPA